MTIKSYETDTVTYTLVGQTIVQRYRSVWFDNIQTTIAIPVQLSKALAETVYQLECLDKSGLVQSILGQTFHSYFDMKSANVVPL